jgi:uncharacterized membrane protein
MSTVPVVMKNSPAAKPISFAAGEFFILFVHSLSVMNETKVTRKDPYCSSLVTLAIVDCLYGSQTLALMARVLGHLYGDLGQA